MKKIIFFLLVLICNKVFAQDILTEVVVNGNISYLDNILNIKQINDFSNIDLKILRNTIYAKYGYKFSSGDLLNHFSQFSWYKGNKINVDKELTKVDWENLNLIKKLENNYGHNVNINDYRQYQREYIYNRGIYEYARQKSDKNIHYFDIISRRRLFSYYTEYDQYKNIIFFKAKYEKNFIYDLINNIIIDTEIDNIDSMVFSDFDEITIKGSHTYEDIREWNNRKEHEWRKITREEIRIKYDVPEQRLNDNIYYKIDVTKKMLNKKIQINEFEGRKTSFFEPIASDDKKYFLFKLFGRYVVFDFTQFKEYYDYIYISAIYNKTFDQYFIFVDYYKGDH
jgi:hypothetical protein